MNGSSIFTRQIYNDHPERRRDYYAQYERRDYDTDYHFVVDFFHGFFVFFVMFCKTNSNT